VSVISMLSSRISEVRALRPYESTPP
jgi:hypothetical protein